MKMLLHGHYGRPPRSLISVSFSQMKEPTAKGKEGTGGLRCAGVRPAHHLPPFVDEEGCGVIPTQRAQVLHRPLLPEERPRLSRREDVIKNEQPQRIGIGNRIESGADHLARGRSTEFASFSYPPSGSVPKSIGTPSFHSTPRCSGKPGMSGSISPFTANPAINPLALMATGALLQPWGSTPRSVMKPSRHTNA